jgi:hypothetical protein
LHKYLIESRAAFNLELQYQQDNPCQNTTVIINIEKSFEKVEITTIIASALDPNSNSSV